VFAQPPASSVNVRLSFGAMCLTFSGQFISADFTARRMGKNLVDAGKWSEQLRVLTSAVSMLFPPKAQFDPNTVLKVPLHTDMFFQRDMDPQFLGDEVLCEPAAARHTKETRGALKAYVVIPAWFLLGRDTSR